MEAVLESKQKEDFDSFKNAQPVYFYSVYHLKANRVNPQKTEKSENSVTQFLDNEATINKDFSLTLLNFDIPGQNESYLRENLAKKIEKGTLYASSHGNISNFTLGFKRNQNEEDIESICYYYLYRQVQSPNNEYLVCFVVQNSAFNMDLFRNELDFYFDRKIETILEHNELNDESKADILRNWYDVSINYVARLVNLLGEKLSVIIEEAFSCGELSFDESLDERTKTDIEFLFKSLNSNYLISNFLHQPPVSPKTKQVETRQIKPRLSIYWDIKIKKEPLKISFDQSTNEIRLSKNDKCKFTKDLTEKLLQIETEIKDPFEIKQVMENYKLELAQELNSFNRLLRKGESNYYDIYRSYIYLKNSPMNSLLINMYTNSCGNMQMLFEPLKVVLDYINQSNNNDRLIKA